MLLIAAIVCHVSYVMILAVHLQHKHTSIKGYKNHIHSQYDVNIDGFMLLVAKEFTALS